MTSCRREPSRVPMVGPDAVTLGGGASGSSDLSDYPGRLGLLSAHILVEPLDGACPCLLGRGFVVAFRRCVIEEAMNRIRIDVALIPDVVFLQLSLLRRVGARQR